MNLPLKVVLVGSNGDWAQKRYLPVLAEAAALRRIELRAIDLESRIRLREIPKVAYEWNTAEWDGMARYVQASKGVLTEDLTKEDRWSPDLVFIVTPDRTHCKIASHWASRLHENGRIFIEKPLDASLKRAQAFASTLSAPHARKTFGFDHYLSASMPFIRQFRSHTSAQRGRVLRIVFQLEEQSPILPERAEALAKGVVFDLGPHALAVTAKVLGWRNLYVERVEMIGGSQYRDSRAPPQVSGPTMAEAHYLFGKVEVSVSLAKYAKTNLK
jgi:predicted dehydrogenase